jgi:hypothetical protein
MLVHAATDGFSIPNWGDVGLTGALVGVAVLVIVSIVRGWLVPKTQHDRELAAANQRTIDAVTRGDEHKAAALEWRKVAMLTLGQNGTLVQTSAVIQDVLRESSPGKLSDTEPQGGG